MSARDRTWQDDRLEPVTVDTTGESELAEAQGEVPRELEGRYGHSGTVLGAGGLGKVLAVRDHVVGREVALKILSAPGRAGGTKGLERRFLREARITAQLEHPGIVPVHDIGRRADGTLYYTMKRVRGRTLAAAIQACHGLPDRLALLPDLLQVAHAVAYAHSRSVVHRDLKPDNVMVGEFGETLVLDWGIARSVHGAGAPTGMGTADAFTPTGPEREQLPRRAKDTAVGTVMGTPAYMAPEQASGRVHEVDARSDVWSLGVMLYELLTGHPPFEGATQDILRDVRTGVLRPVRELCPEAPPDLAAVVERAMSIHRSDRYPSAKEFAAEVEAWLTGHRVSAYQYGRAEIARRFVAQHRATLTMGVVGLAALLVLGAGSAWRLRQEREAAVVSLAETLRARADAALPLDPVAAAVYAAGSLALTETPEARGVAMSVARRWVPRLRQRFDEGRPCRLVAFSPDGGRLACAGEGVLTVHAPDEETLSLPLPAGGLAALSIGADGALLGGTPDGALLRWEDGGPSPLPLGPHGPLAGLASLPDGGWVAAFDAPVGGTGALLVSLDGAGRERHRQVWPRRVADLVTAGARVWFVGRDDVVVGVDPLTLETTPVPGPPGRPLHTVDALPSGALAVGAADGTTAVSEPGGLGWRVAGGENGTGRLRFASGGRLLANVRENGRVRLFDTVAVSPLADLPERATPTAVAVSPDGSALAVGGDDGQLRLWALDTADDATGVVGLYGGVVQPDAVLFSPDGARVLIASTPTGVLQGFDAATGRPGATLAVPGLLGAAGFVDGDRVVVLRAGGLGVVDLRTGETEDHPTGPVAEVVVLSGSELLVLDPTGQALKWSLSTRAPAGRLAGHWGWILPGPRGGAVLFDLEQHRPVVLDDTFRAAKDLDGQATERGGDTLPRAVSLDGTRLALAAADGRVTVVDTRTGEVRHDQRSSQPIHRLALSADGALVAFATPRQEVTVAAVGRSRALAVLRGHADRVDAITFSPDGRQLLTASRDGDVRAWDLTLLDVPGATLAARAETAFGHRLVSGRLEPSAP